MLLNRPLVDKKLKGGAGALSAVMPLLVLPLGFKKDQWKAKEQEKRMVRTVNEINLSCEHQNYGSVVFV